MRFDEEAEVLSPFSSSFVVHVHEAVPIPARDALLSPTGVPRQEVFQRNQTLPIALGIRRENAVVRDHRKTFE